jgi:hypothetical protein
VRQRPVRGGHALRERPVRGRLHGGRVSRGSDVHRGDVRGRGRPGRRGGARLRWRGDRGALRRWWRAHHAGRRRQPRCRSRTRRCDELGDLATRQGVRLPSGRAGRAGRRPGVAGRGSGACRDRTAPALEPARSLTMTHSSPGN